MINLILCSPENETCPVLSEIGITLNVMLPKCPSSRSVKNSRYFSILHICRITSSLFLLACFFTFDSDTTQISPTSFNHNFLLLINPLQGLQWTVSVWFCLRVVTGAHQRRSLGSKWITSQNQSGFQSYFKSWVKTKEQRGLK